MVFNNSTTATFYSTTYFADSTDNSLDSPHIEEQFHHTIFYSTISPFNSAKPLYNSATIHRNSTA